MRIIDDVLLQADPLLEMFRGKFFSGRLQMIWVVFYSSFLFYKILCRKKKKLLNSLEIYQRELHAGILLEIFRKEFHLEIADLAA